jgi:hypothetical protein
MGTGERRTHWQVLNPNLDVINESPRFEIQHPRDFHSIDSKVRASRQALKDQPLPTLDLTSSRGDTCIRECQTVP